MTETEPIDWICKPKNNVEFGYSQDYKEKFESAHVDAVEYRKLSASWERHWNDARRIFKIDCDATINEALDEMRKIMAEYEKLHSREYNVVHVNE